MRKLLNQFKETVYKDDLKRVLTYCSISAILFGVLAGALQYLAIITLNITTSIVIYIIAYMIGKELRDRVMTYHILYSILGVVFFFLGYIFYNVSYAAFIYKDIPFVLSYFFSPNGFLNLAFGFIDFKYDPFGSILDIIIMIFCIMTVWRMSAYRK